jgi:hypothetical protein
MNHQTDDRDSLTAEEAAFVGRVRELYAPPELAATRRAALDAELRQRVEAGWGFGTGRSAWLAVATAGALAIAWLVAIGDEGALTPELSRAAPVVAQGADVDDWDRELFDPTWVGDSERFDDSAELPDDYAAIAGIFLDS